MTKIKNISPHRPSDLVLDIDVSDVNEYLKSGEFIVDDNEEEVKEEVKKVVPEESWTELQIYDWIQENNIDIDYKPQRDTKKYIFKKLKELKII